jgi:hypothetical protein
MSKQKPRIKKQKTTPAASLPKPRVFLDPQRRVFLLLTEEGHHNRYLTLGDNGVEVVKLDHAAPRRNDKGFLPEDTTSAAELIVYEDYDLEKATQKLYNSFLHRTPEAVREMCVILGKPVPEIPEAIKQARKASGERLRAARPQLTKPGDDAVVTLVPKAKAVEGLSSRATKVLKLLAEGKAKGMTVTALGTALGKNIHAGAVVARLKELGLVKVAG